QIKTTLVFIAFKISWVQVYIPATVRIQSASCNYIPIGRYYFVITQPFQRKSHLIVGRKRGSKQTRMPTCLQGENSKRQNNGHRHTFKLGMYRTGKGHLIRDEFNMLANKRKMRRI